MGVLLCTPCFLQNHRTERSFHNADVIETYLTQIKQTVWILITKLDKAILKLRFLQSQSFLSKIPTEPETEWLLSKSSQRASDFKQKLEKMIEEIDPFQFKQF